jgi:ribosomal protein L24
MLLHSDSPVSIEPMPIKLGDKVRIIRGQLQGLEGYAISCTGSSANVCVKLNILGCAKVKINISDIAKI